MLYGYIWKKDKGEIELDVVDIKKTKLTDIKETYVGKIKIIINKNGWGVILLDGPKDIMDLVFNYFMENSFDNIEEYDYIKLSKDIQSS